MRVLVTGPRTWGIIPKDCPDVASRARVADLEGKLLYAALDILKPALVIHGGAAGADTLAGLWATFHGVKTRTSPAPFASLGPIAGPMRNHYMLTMHRPDLVLACGPGGTPGTDNCVKQARLLGIEVKEIKL